MPNYCMYILFDTVGWTMGRTSSLYKVLRGRTLNTFRQSHTQLVHVYLNWFRHNSLLQCVSQPEIAKKSIKPPILAFKVIQIIILGTNREPVYDFLLVINSNLGPILHCY